MAAQMLRAVLSVTLISTVLLPPLSMACAQNIAEQSVAAPTAMHDYVQRKDGAFAWEVLGQQELPQGKIYDVLLTSQEWQGIVWKHSLEVYEPAVIHHPKHMLLMVTGGSIGKKTGKDDMQRGSALAKLCGARVAIIHQVPNQPLFGDHVEDDLITETWLKYLETGDETWPLLFPMVKSAVKAMDAMQEMAAKHWNSSVDGFVITGASKRGWTSWLTPVVDKRVVATAPIVIDVLNFRAQMKHQLDTWGAYSEQIADYTSKGLIVEGDESPREMKLRLMVDPYTYRDQLKLPKLMVNGTNDPYWVVDSTKWYWDDLQGPKYILQVPNAGHGLDGGQELALSTISAFFQHVASSTPMPVLSWKHTLADDTITLSVTSSETPKSARLWTSDSTDKDFRDEKWESKVLDCSGDRITGSLAKPKSGYCAEYIQLEYEFNDVPYSMCTLIYRD